MERLRKIVSTRLLACWQSWRMPIVATVACIAMTLSGACTSSVGSETMRESIKELDRSIAERPSHIAARAASVKALSDSLDNIISHTWRMAVTKTLLDEVRHFDVDSSLSYCNRAIAEARAVGDEESARYFEIRRIDLLPLKIRIYESLKNIDTTDVSRLSPANRVAFFRAARQAYVYLTTIYSPREVDRSYFDRMGAFSDSLLRHVDRTDKEYPLYLGSSYASHGNMSLSIATLSEYLSTLDRNSQQYSDAASMLAMVYFMGKRYEEWALALTRAARAENMQAVLDGEALRQLSRYLYFNDAPDKAYDYVTVAEDNESRSGAVVHRVHIAETLPLIDGTYRDSQRRVKMLLVVLVVSLVVILLLVTAFLLRRRRERRALDTVKDNLARANATKEVYIGRFLQLSYIYMDKMQEMNKLVGRKLSAGQIEDLYHMVKTGKMEEEQRLLFYKEFDDAFIHIYPNFIKRVNALMKDGYRLADDNSSKLTPELRILAFMRLGMEDSNKIARFLNLSVNTIYTYRNRMKNHAQNRENFEHDVMAIDDL